MPAHATTTAPVRRRIHIHLIPSAIIGVLLTLGALFNEPASPPYELGQFLSVFLFSIPPALAANRLAQRSLHWASNDAFWGAALFGGLFWALGVAAGWVLSMNVIDALVGEAPFALMDTLSSIFTGTVWLGLFLVPLHFHFSFAQRRAAGHTAKTP
jgi:hypothetical protein